MKILIMGLPGSGKTTLAEELRKRLESRSRTVDWFNADKVRSIFQDWDFSYEGRIRQSERMAQLAATSNADYIICDFVAPLGLMREKFDADFLIWMDTISQGRYEDTNRLFEPPIHYNLRIDSLDSKRWAAVILDVLCNQT